MALNANLYWQQKAQIKVQADTTDAIEIKKGVRQGCVMSPCLFNLYTESIFRQIETAQGLKVGGHNINNLRYADDTVLLAENKEDLQKLLSMVNEESREKGLFMNAKKTKTMVITKQKEPIDIDIKIEECPVEQVKEFTYLGQLVTSDAKSDKEIKRRIMLAKNAFMKLKPILTNTNISIRTRMRCTKCYVWSIFLYGCETWTLTAQTEKRIEAFEM